MNTGRLKRSAVLALIMCVLLLAVLSSATLAWFTANLVVSTGRATARTATQEVSLEISSTGGDSFNPVPEATITQVNAADLSRLLPVSTADLQSFVACITTNSAGFATSFAEAGEESSYFHGRIYLRAVISGGVAGTAVNLYLDERESSGGALAVKSGSDSLLLNAARLGLIFDNDPATAQIFRLSREENSAADRAANTVVNGVRLADNMVLRMESGTVTAVPDPAKDLADYSAIDETDIQLETPLFRMEPDRIYPVDIYFYLEGCDPDCTDAVSFDEGDLHLGFLGVLS